MADTISESDEQGLVYGSYEGTPPKPEDLQASFITVGSEQWQTEARRQAQYESGLSNSGAYDEMLGRKSRTDTEHVTSRMLQPTLRHTGGGGGGSKGRKPARKKMPPKGYSARVDDREEKLPRFTVDGLSRAEAEFYHSRRGTARVVLAELADAIMDASPMPNTNAPPKKTSLAHRRGFEVYGLSKDQIMALRADPGIATKRLRAFAFDEAGFAINVRDRAFY